MGSALVRELLHHNYTILAVDLAGHQENLPNDGRVSFIPADNWEAAVADNNYVYYCVGTDGQADLTYLYGALEQTLKAIHDDWFRVLVTKSTIPPSTTQKRIVPFLEARGVKVPEELGVANNPEFLREGHCWEDFTKADRIVIGVSDARSEELLRKLYQKERAPICCVSLNTGEFIKYLSNTSLACLISYANEMSEAADAIGGIDVANAFRILHMDKRWQEGGIRAYFYPGCGYGGYCLPKDTNAFYAVSKKAGFDGQILKNVIEVNNSMPEVTMRRIVQAAGGEKSVCIGILGLSFNPGSDDVRDTPSAKIIDALNKLSYENIIAYDPVATEEFRAHHTLKCRFAPNLEAVLEEAETIAITTAWPEFAGLRERTDKPIVDCRYML